MKSIRLHQKIKRHKRIRAVVTGTDVRPRVAVYKSNTGLFVQLIDDVARTTLASVKIQGKNITAAKSAGVEIAQKAKKLNISKIVFDRGGYRYHGVIQALADAIRDGGIQV